MAKEGSFVSLTGSGIGFIPGEQEHHVGTEMEGVVLDYDAAQNIYSIGMYVYCLSVVCENYPCVNF